MDEVVLLAHAGVTLAMVGVMFTVQLVVYPQFRSVPVEVGPAYAAAHGRRIVAVLAPFAPAEVVLALVVWLRQPAGVSRWLPLVAGLLLVAAWVSTALWYAPLHNRLQRGPFTSERVDRLITGNWLRTGLWSARGVLALAMVAQLDG